MTHAEAAARSSRRSNFDPLRPNLVLVDTIKRSALIELALSAVNRKFYELRHQAPDALRTRQVGRRTKANPGKKVTISRLRPERAATYVRILRWALPRTDVERGDVYRWKGSRGVSERFDLEEWTTGTQLSRDRLEHGLSDLHAGDLLFSRQGRERDGDDWIGHVAIRKVTRELWRFLGLEAERQAFLEHLGQIERRRLEREQEARAAAAATEAAISHAPPAPWPGDKWEHLTLPERMRARDLALEIQRDNPGWSHDQVNAFALEQLGLAPPPLPPDEWDE